MWAFGQLLTGARLSTYAVRYNGTRWARIPFPLFAQAAGELSAGDIWVVGSWGIRGFWLSATEYAKTSFRGYLYHYSGGHWTRIPVPNEPRNITQVSALASIPGTRSVWAVGVQTGASLQPHAIILKYGP